MALLCLIKKIISMGNKNLMGEFFPIVENWLRATISEEVAKALEADRQKKKPTRQFTRQEVADLLHVSLPTLWDMTKKGKIKSTKVGKRVLYESAEVQRVLGKEV